jgi:N-acetylglucosaminyldiphosphoundecaprenol N-acetyl-beta-D-mannosaminyltransferase
MKYGAVHRGFDLSVSPATPRESDFFGISVFDSSLEELVSRIEENLKDKTSTHIVALNPDGFLISQRDPDFRRILSIAEFVICDGVGILLASRLFSEQEIKHRLVGSGLMMRLCELSASKGHRIFLLGGTEGAAERCASSLQERISNLQIVGIYEPPLVTDERCFDNVEIVERINSRKPDILFVALGAPKQEKWIERHRRELTAPILMGVGASFNFIGGKVRRAPVWMQRVGLEWLFRLLIEPRRLAKRYLIGIPRFFLVTAQLHFRSQLRKGFP